METSQAEEILTLADIQAEDYAACSELLTRTASLPVQERLAELRNRLGALGVSPLADAPPSPPGEDLLWLEALLRFLPELQQWFRGREIPEPVIADTLADFGRQIALSRQTTGKYGLETYRWCVTVAAGLLVQLGRLQFELIPTPKDLVSESFGEQVLTIHIPAAGSLNMTGVKNSLQQALPFFQQHFPEYPVQYATCVSWLLDPYLQQHLPPDANIVRFAQLFTPYGVPGDAAEDALYFVFRTRNMQELPLLPQQTSLQRLVVNRLSERKEWELARGYVDLQIPLKPEP